MIRRSGSQQNQAGHLAMHYAVRTHAQAADVCMLILVHICKPRNSADQPLAKLPGCMPVSHFQRDRDSVRQLRLRRSTLLLLLLHRCEWLQPFPLVGFRNVWPAKSSTVCGDVKDPRDIFHDIKTYHSLNTFHISSQTKQQTQLVLKMVSSTSMLLAMLALAASASSASGVLVCELVCVKRCTYFYQKHPSGACCEASGCATAFCSSCCRVRLAHHHLCPRATYLGVEDNNRVLAGQSVQLGSSG